MENSQELEERTHEGMKLLRELLQEIKEQEERGNEVFMVWGIPKNVVAEFKEKIIKPKYHSTGMSYKDAVTKEIMGFMVESIKNEKKE